MDRIIANCKVHIYLGCVFPLVIHIFVMAKHFMDQVNLCGSALPPLLYAIECIGTINEIRA